MFLYSRKLKMTVTESIDKLRKYIGNVVEESRFTKGVRAFDSFFAGLGPRLESYQQRTGPRRKYTTELVLKIPLFFFLHQWSLLSPTSDYRLIELLLFVFRYIGKKFRFVFFSHIFGLYV